MEVSLLNNQNSIASKEFQFPAFYISKNSKNFYFKSYNFQSGSLNFLSGESRSGKSLYLRCLTGLEEPLDKPDDLSFLSYHIVYKPQTIKPKYEGTINDFIILHNLGEQDLFFKYHNFFSIQKIENKKIKELTETEKQIFSLFLFFLKDGEIYILDYPTELFDYEFRLKLSNDFKLFCLQKNKTGFICESDANIIKNISNSGDSIINFSSFNENKFFNKITLV